MTGKESPQQQGGLFEREHQADHETRLQLCQ